MPEAPTLSSPPEITIVTERTIACDGGDGAFGHPRVFLRILEREVQCPYCSRRFVLAEGADDNSAH